MTNIQRPTIDVVFCEKCNDIEIYTIICWDNQKRLKFLSGRSFKIMALDTHEEVCFGCHSFGFVKKLDEQQFAYENDLFIEIISVVKH